MDIRDITGVQLLSHWSLYKFYGNKDIEEP